MSLLWERHLRIEHLVVRLWYHLSEELHVLRLREHLRELRHLHLRLLKWIIRLLKYVHLRHLRELWWKRHTYFGSYRLWRQNNLCRRCVAALMSLFLEEVRCGHYSVFLQHLHFFHLFLGQLCCFSFDYYFFGDFYLCHYCFL